MVRHLSFFVFMLLLAGLFFNSDNVLAQPVQISSGQAQQLNADDHDIEAIVVRNDWKPYTGTLERDGEIFWFRQPLDLTWTDASHASNPLALSLQVTGLYEAYWDGKLVASNRHRGIKAPEFSRLLLPVDAISNGEHWLYFRLEGMGLMAGDNVRLGIYPTDLASDFFGIHFTVIVVFLVTTTSFIASAYFLYVSRQGGEYWTCRIAAICTFLAGSLMYLSRARFLTPYPYSWQPVIDLAMAGMTITFMLSIPAYGALRLNLSRPALWSLGALGVIVLALPESIPFDTDTRALLLLGLYMLGLCGYAYRTGQKNAPRLAAGVGIGILALVLQPDQKMLFVATVTLLFAIELGVDLHRRRSETRQLELLSARLRGDLLRHNIKPHFLMNSLTALMEWVETRPSEAIEFIDGLAEEFRLLSDFSDRSAVNLRDEIKLCQVHIGLMSKRLGSSLLLNVGTMDQSALVPPALFHTLVENAISHNDYRGSTIEMHLKAQSSQLGTAYEFRAPVIGQKASGTNTGLGNRYVRARLEEFCGNAFSFTSEQVGSHWVSTVELYKG